MSSTTVEIVELCEALPLEKQAEIADFARFLLARQGDERWEQIISDPTPRPKLEAYFRQAEAEGEEPLDLDRM